ncbi:RICIN domain-containing protein [Hahella sp. CCB-MM4]|uniref:RICIN domain-containing protein n=1 Tax=Hahella sp. (strain CCB-MM4) TaxID=1926491 RepID=UPI00143DFBC4|nr:RICIN domain-containing protein [Hahella sp. CCB-MM4]
MTRSPIHFKNIRQARLSRYLILPLVSLIGLPALADSTIKVATTYESAGFTIDTTSAVTVDYSLGSDCSGPWKSGDSAYLDTYKNVRRVSLVNLQENTQYSARIRINQGSEYCQPFKTLNPNVPVAKSYSLSQIRANSSSDGIYFGSNGQLQIDRSGSADGWIRIYGTPGDNLVDAGYSVPSAVVFDSNAHYILLEGLEIRGGNLQGIVTSKWSSDVIIRNNDISQWGRSEIGQRDPAINLKNVSRYRIEKNFIHDPRGNAKNRKNNKAYEGPAGISLQPSTESTANHVITGNMIIGSDSHRFEDGIMAQGEPYKWDNSGAKQDTDFSYNYIAFTNDDGVELDGGGQNLRFFKNKLEGSYSALSVAPIHRGPVYVYRNIFSRTGDVQEGGEFVVKAGGYEEDRDNQYNVRDGIVYFYNNTIFTAHSGINALVRNNNLNRPIHFVTRNNIIQAGSSVYAIRDTDLYEWTSYDYDLISSLSGSGKLSISGDSCSQNCGQESHGIFDLPYFINDDVDDFRIYHSSPAIDKGVTRGNLTGQYNGQAPDMGAMEYGSNVPPYLEKVAVIADKYRVLLAADETNKATITFTAQNNFGSSKVVRVMKPQSTDWFHFVGDTEKTLSANGKVSFTIELDPTVVPSVNQVAGAFILRVVESGLSVPVSVYARSLDNEWWTPKVGTYLIKNQYTQKALRPIGSSQNSNDSVVQYAPHSEWKSEQWEIKYSNDAGYYYIQNVYSGMRLRPKNSDQPSGYQDGNAIVQFTPYDAWNSEKWELRPVRGKANTFYIVNKLTGKALRPETDSNNQLKTNDNALLVQHHMEPTWSSMQWVLEKVE